MTEKDSELKEQLKLTNELLEVVLGKDTFFKSARGLFKKYWNDLQKKRPANVTQDVHHYSGEAFSKFWQLDFLLEKIKALEHLMESRRQETILNGDPVQKWIQKIGQNDETSTMPNVDEMKEVINSMKDTSMYELELYTECFYYVAHRLKKIIEYYPGLKDFNFTPTGVISVRNNLIEHPHGKSGVTFPSFGLGNPNGPVIKGARIEMEKNKSVDEGLYKNAQEYKELLEAVLHKGLNSLSI